MNRSMWRLGCCIALLATSACAARRGTEPPPPEPELLMPPPPQASESLAPASLVPPQGELRTAADEALAERVGGALDTDPLLAGAEIDVVVRDGVVTLGGYVESELQRERARALARTTAGVRRVEGDLLQVD